MRSRLGTRALVAVVVLAGTLGGCAEEETDPAGAAGGAGASSTPAPSAPDGSASPTPTVDLASGPELGSEGLVRLRVPQGWRADTSTDSTQIAWEADRKFYVSLTLSEDFTPELYGEAWTTEEKAKSARRVMPEPHQVRLLEPFELAGVEVFHLSGPDPYAWIEMFGGTHEGTDVVIEFEFPSDTPAKVRQRHLDQILPTVEWL